MKYHPRISLLLACSAIGMARNTFDNEDSQYAIPTVLIDTKNGPVRINASDYDEKQHKLSKDGPKPVEPETLGQQEPAPAPAAAPPATPAPLAPGAPADLTPNAVVAPGVMQEGSKWFVVDMNAENAKIADATGYPTKAKANEAAAALVPPAPAA